MSSINPYAPPKADVADIVDAVAPQPIKLWSARGRIGRLRFVAYSVLGYAAVWIAMMVAGGVGVAGRAVSDASHSPGAGFGVLFFLIVVPSFVAFFVFGVLQSIKRLHDFGWSGWWWLLSFVPFINFILGLAMLFVPGDRASNAYGAPPPPNKAVHWIVALGVGGMFVLGIVAAIAIPQYQDYVNRARAAQQR